jgi:hypothetical protein
LPFHPNVGNIGQVKADKCAHLTHAGHHTEKTTGNIGKQPAESDSINANQLNRNNVKGIYLALSYFIPNSIM